MSDENLNLEQVTPEELRLAGELRDALARDEVTDDRAWLNALRHGYAPGDLSAEELHHLVAEAIAFAPTEAELASAKAFRDDLEANTGDAALVRDALRAALGETDVPRDLGERARRAIDAPKKGRVLSFRPRSITAAASIVMAVAAAFLLYVRAGAWFGGAAPSGMVDLRASLVPARSTQELFDEPFDARASLASPSRGSSRIDRIAQARTSDYRHNRFARWGVK
ncbi:MAG: hypothetical protein U0174_24045 [Polyangiaceae bacterium]